MLILANLYRI